MTESSSAYANPDDDQSLNAKILVVEDDISLLHGIRSILQLDEYNVLIAKNGVEALEIMRGEFVPPDLIISDIMMPQMDGNELLREVRKETRWLEIPFIFLTAKSGRDDIQEGVALGADDYITKPYDPEYLRVTVRSRLQRKANLGRLHAQNIDQIKHNILTILNHEFRTPLTFVVAYADMLDMPSDSSMSNEHEMLTYLKGISSGAERLRRLIENFILLVEMETGEAQLAVEMRRTHVTDLRPVIQPVCDTVLGQTPERYQLNIPDSVPTVHIDPEYIAHALRHLLENAVKFSPPDSPIIIDVRPEQDALVLSVQDFGRGIPEEEMAHIWTMFYQVRRDFYEDQGAGSGLAIVKGVAELHGGQVSVESVTDEGSTFSLRLPLASA